jgi:hypothetical protein
MFWLVGPTNNMQPKVSTGVASERAVSVITATPSATPSLWQPAASAPFDRDLELAVIDRMGTHALVFRCRRAQTGWINARTGRRVDIDPTHWRDWSFNHGL